MLESETLVAFATWIVWCNNSIWYRHLDTTCYVYLMEKNQKWKSTKTTWKMTICFIRCRNWLPISNFLRDLIMTHVDSAFPSKSLMVRLLTLQNRKMHRSSSMFSLIELKQLSSQPLENTYSRESSVGNRSARWFAKNVEKSRTDLKISTLKLCQSRISSQSTIHSKNSLKVKWSATSTVMVVTRRLISQRERL